LIFFQKIKDLGIDLVSEGKKVYKEKARKAGNALLNNENNKEKRFFNSNEEPPKSNNTINPNQINFKEIERIYYELYQEKKKIRIQENKLKKFNNLLKKKEFQIEEEKNKIQKKKDCIKTPKILIKFIFLKVLTEEENSLVSEKEKCKERIKIINREKEIYIDSQNVIKQEITRLETTNIKHKLRGDILLKKLNDQTKYMDEINDQIYWSSESLHHMTEKLSYVTMSCLDPGNLGNEDEIFYKKQEDKLVKNDRDIINFKKHRNNHSLELSSYQRKGSSMDFETKKTKVTKKLTEEEKNNLFLIIKEQQNIQNQLFGRLGNILKEE